MCEGWSEVRRGEVELSSLEVTVDIAAYLRLEFIAMQSCSRTVKIDANWSFLFLSEQDVLSREKKSRKQLAQMCCGYAGASGALPAMPWNAVNWLYTVVVVLVVARFPRNETG